MAIREVYSLKYQTVGAFNNLTVNNVGLSLLAFNELSYWHKAHRQMSRTCTLISVNLFGAITIQ